MAKDEFARAFASNHKWASNLCETQPTFFTDSAKGQSPKILWIGCADSRVPETTILGLNPGDVFVHRNIANVLTPNDLNSLSVIEFAVRYLKVDHAIVCGHTSCGGVIGALGNKSLGIMDPWLQPIRRLRMSHGEELEKLEGDTKTTRLSELNVLQSVHTLKTNPTVIEAIKTRGFQVHGVIYDLGSGKLEEVADPETETAATTREAAFSTSA